MAARSIKIRHDENTRQKIRVGELITRLHKHFMGEIDMTPTQIQAGRILLDRTLPVLQAVEHSGEITTSKVIRSPEISKTTDDWGQLHIPKHIQHVTEH